MRPPGTDRPSSNATAEPEFRRALPDDVTVHGARMPLESVTVGELDAMSDDIHGPGFDTELEERLADAAGVPAVATARSVVRALEALDAGRIAVVTPYTADLDAKERDFLEAAGFEVASIDGRGLEANTEIGALTSADAERQVLEQVDGDAADLDAVFVSCTDYRSLSTVGSLESKLGVPVVTSNGATLWDVCGVAGLEVSFDGVGSLLECNRQ